MSDINTKIVALPDMPISGIGMLSQLSSKTILLILVTHLVKPDPISFPVGQRDYPQKGFLRVAYSYLSYKYVTPVLIMEAFFLAMSVLVSCSETTAHTIGDTVPIDTVVSIPIRYPHYSTAVRSKTRGKHF